MILLSFPYECYETLYPFSDKFLQFFQNKHTLEDFLIPFAQGHTLFPDCIKLRSPWSIVTKHTGGKHRQRKTRITFFLPPVVYPWEMLCKLVRLLRKSTHKAINRSRSHAGMETHLLMCLWPRAFPVVEISHFRGWQIIAAETQHT